MRLLITSGPTREPIDAVRFISNRSSGRLGAELATCAARAGHAVTLLHGPGAIEPPPGPNLAVVGFTSTADLQARLAEHFPACDALVMAAAVADYTPKRLIDGKTERGAGLTLELVPTADVVAALAPGRRADQRIVAFALEDAANLERRATEKMRRKQVDAIVANPLATMDAEGIDPLFLTADGRRDAPGPMTKIDFARWLLDRVEGLFPRP